MNTDQQPNLGFGGMLSTCPTTKVILPHTWGKMANNVCLGLIVKNNFSLYICMHVNHYHVERQCIYACLSCVGFKICELITNDLIL